MAEMRVLVKIKQRKFSGEPLASRSANLTRLTATQLEAPSGLRTGRRLSRFNPGKPTYFVGKILETSFSTVSMSFSVNSPFLKE
jgi:hypothetical protein